MQLSPYLVSTPRLKMEGVPTSSMDDPWLKTEGVPPLPSIRYPSGMTYPLRIGQCPSSLTAAEFARLHDHECATMSRYVEYASLLSAICCVAELGMRCVE